MKKNVVLIRNAQAYDFGGGERFPVFLASVLKDSDFNPVILSRSRKLRSFANEQHIRTINGWWWSKQNWSGKNTLLFPIYFIWQLILFFYYVVSFVKLRPQVVHIQSKDDFIAATYAARLVNAQVIWTDHADLKHIWQNLTVRYKNPIGKIIFKAAKHTSAITVVSQSELQLVSSHLPINSPQAKKLSVVYNGAFDSKDNYPAYPHSEVVYICASRLVKDKGINELVDAFMIISKKYTNTQLIIIGDGPDGEEFRKKASQNSAIQFLGHQNNPLASLSKADIFVHPTYHEGFSLALVEACMMQLAIIATNVGGNPEIIKQDITGLLVPSKDSNELAHEMEKLYLDKKLRTSLATNARREFIEKFNFEDIVKKDFIPLYNEASK